MNKTSIRDSIRHQPFKPFVITTVGGQRFEITEADTIAVSPGQEIAIVFTMTNYHVIDTTKIESLEVL